MIACRGWCLSGTKEGRGKLKDTENNEFLAYAMMESCECTHIRWEALDSWKKNVLEFYKLKEGLAGGI